MSVSLTSVQAARHAPHTPAVPTSKTSDAAAESKCKLYLADAAQFQNELHGSNVVEREREKKDEQTKEEIILYV